MGDWRRHVPRLLERDGSNCALCGRELGGDVTVDHIIPRARGGTSDPINLQLAHMRCNGDKGDGVASPVASDTALDMGAGLKVCGDYWRDIDD